MKKLAIPSLLVAVIASPAYATGGFASKYNFPVILSPENPAAFNGVQYERALEVLNRYYSINNVISYGQPIQVQPNIEKNGFDLSTFDDFVITVGEDEVVSQPNRGEIP